MCGISKEWATVRRMIVVIAIVVVMIIIVIIIVCVFVPYLLFGSTSTAENVSGKSAPAL